MKRLRLAAAVMGLVAAFATPLIASGLWWGIPQYQGGSYCVSFSAFPTTVTVPNVAPTPSQCNETAPAGPTAFTGFEAIPVDLFGPQAGLTQTGPSTMYVNVMAMGQGPVFTNTTAGSVTIPNNVSLYVENVGNTSATITLPAAPSPGQIVRVQLATAQTTSVIFGASAGQTCVPACPFTSSVVAAGTGDAWQFNSSTSVWTKIY